MERLAGRTISLPMLQAGSRNLYVLIGYGGATNPKEGHTYAVTSNGSNTLTVDTPIR
jgi:hypothetical protein